MAKQKKKTSKKAKKSAPKKTKKVSKKKAVAKPAKKSAKKTVKKAAKKTVQKASKAPAKKTSKKVAKKAPSQPKKSVMSPEVTLIPGQKAPLFNLPDSEGHYVALESLQGKTVVLYFYPKDDTPGCTQESCDFRDSHMEFESKDVVILGISKDSTDSHQKFKSKYSLPFPLLSDADGKVCEEYGVWKEKSMYGKTYMGIERTTIVIDPAGNISKVYPKVNVTGHAQDVLREVSQ